MPVETPHPLRRCGFMLEEQSGISNMTDEPEAVESVQMDEGSGCPQWLHILLLLPQARHPQGAAV